MDIPKISEYPKVGVGANDPSREQELGQPLGGGPAGCAAVGADDPGVRRLDKKPDEWNERDDRWAKGQ